MQNSNGIYTLIKLSHKERRLTEKFEQARASGDVRKMQRITALLTAIQNRTIELSRLDRFLDC